jgi:hypothetical protein
MEFVRDLKKFIFSMACWKLSQVATFGHERGSAKISYLPLKALINTKTNGRK